MRVALRGGTFQCPDSEVRIIMRRTRLANFGIKGTLAIYDSSAAFGFEVPTQTRGYNDRNFKSTALGRLWCVVTGASVQVPDLRERDLEYPFELPVADLDRPRFPRLAHQ